MPFKKLGLNEHILKAIQEAGYTEPSPIQAAAIPEIIAGHDVIGIAQTGTGKTAAFTLPILNALAAKPVPNDVAKKTRVLVLAPTRELVAQIEENIIAYAKHLPALRIGKIYGGVGEQPQIKALRSGCDIIIACPGRLLDLMNQGHSDFSKITHLVLDEADRMLDMGFLPDIKRIVSKLRNHRQTLMFSATFSPEIEKLTHDFQKAAKVIQIGRRNDPAKTVSQSIYEVPRHLKTNLLIHLLEDQKMEMVLVFSRTKHGADKIAKKLQIAGITSATIHANRSQNQRMRALEDFKAWRVRVLVATDIAARGIDVDGITHVVNFDFPSAVDDYVHRIGRTGRAAATGAAISFVSGEDTADVRAVERKIGTAIPRKRAEDFDYKAEGQPEAPRGPRQQQGQGRNRNESGRGGNEQGRGSRSGGGNKNQPQRSGPPPAKRSDDRRGPPSGKRFDDRRGPAQATGGPASAPKRWLDKLRNHITGGK